MPRRSGPIAIAQADTLVLCSDLHLSDSIPACRKHAGEEQWIKDQSDVLEWLGVQAAYSGVVCAGDVFDEPYKNCMRPSPALLTMCLLDMPNHFHCVPGQHDLPGHSLDMLHKTGLFTLSVAGRVNILLRGDPIVQEEAGWRIVGFPWGTAPGPKEMAQHRLGGLPVLAVTHRMAWKGAPPFPGASEDGNAEAIAREFKGADVVVTGDNHSAFVYQPKDKSLPVIINPGSLLRLRSDQADYEPRAYILGWDEMPVWKEMLYPDSTEIARVVPDEESLVHERAKFQPFVDALNSKRNGAVSYEDNVKRVLEGIRPSRPVTIRVLDSLKEE